MQIRSVDYQLVTVTLSHATFSRLQQANPFNKDRAAQNAIDVIRIALLTMYPPQTPDDWKDKTRFPSPTRTMLRFLYDVVRYLLRKVIGRTDDLAKDTNDVGKPSIQLTLKIPVALVKWIEKIAQERGLTFPEATVYAIEYGHRVSDSHPAGAKEVRKVWADIVQMMWKRLVDSPRSYRSLHAPSSCTERERLRPNSVSLKFKFQRSTQDSCLHYLIQVVTLLDRSRWGTLFE